MHSFKLISFNIDGDGTNREATRHWNNREILCGDILNHYSADLIGLQEVQAQNYPMLDKTLSKYTSNCGLRSMPQTDENTFYNPIYWNSERFELLDAGAFYLSQTPETWSKAWDAMYVRSATWVHLQCLQTGIPFIYMNVHLDHRGLQARIESSKLIIRRLMQLCQPGDLPVILAGDFNERAWSPINENVHEYPPPILPQYLPPGDTIHRIFTEQKFRDVYLEAGNKNQLAMNTYHDYYGGAFPSVALRIDWILILNGRQHIHVQKYLRINDASPPIYASDHYPIMAELEWRKNQSNSFDG